MAVQFAYDGGLINYSLATPTSPGQWSSAVATLVNNAPSGAATTYAIALVAGGSGNVNKILSANYAGSVTGFRFYVSGSFNAGGILWQGLDGANSQIELRTDALGHIYVTRNGTQIGSTSTLQLVANQGWTYGDVNPVIATGTGGSVLVYINNVQWLNITGVNTSNTGNAWINRFVISNPFTITMYLRDVYFVDTGTGQNTSRLGDVTIGLLFPNAAGVNQQWTNNGGASQTASVQDGITQTGTWPDGDATYISSSTTNQISDFAHQTLTLTGTIFAVGHAMYVRKDDAGSRTTAGVCLSGSATAVGATQNLGNSYQYFTDWIEQDPNTSAQWLVSGLNSATFGIKELS